MTSVNNNNSGPNGNHPKKHNKNTGWIIGGSIAGAVAVPAIGYGIYELCKPKAPPSKYDTFVKHVLPQAKGLVKPALGIGALFGAYKLVQKAVTHDFEAGEESLLGRASDWLGGFFGGGHNDLEGHPDDYHG